MSTTQLALIIGTIWLAPHAPRLHGELFGIACVITAIACEYLAGAA